MMEFGSGNPITMDLEPTIRGPRKLLLTIGLSCGLLVPGFLLAQAAPRRVVILSDTEVVHPANHLQDLTIRKTLSEAGLGPIEFYSEGLDAYRFHSADFESEFAPFLIRKYRGREPSLVFVLGEIPLMFLIRNREHLWPNAPVVFTQVESKFLETVPRPAWATGIIDDEEFVETARLALRLQSKARRILLVGGIGELEMETNATAARDLHSLRPPIEVTERLGVPVEDFPKEFGSLPPDTIVMYTYMFRDSRGHINVPQDVAKALAAAAPAPVYGTHSTFLGTGITGGALFDHEYVGRAAAALGLRILRGETPESIPPQKGSPRLLAVDDRVLRRFGIPESRVPPGYEIRFRTSSFWELYRWRIIAVSVTLALETLLVIGLLAERRSRKRAESESRQRRQELAHAARLMVVGELTASIAHEINQPLGAILANVKAVEMLHDPASANGVEVRQILADIRKDNVRASDVIRHVRGLAAHRETEMGAVDVNALASDVCSLLGAEATRRSVVLELDLEEDLPPVQGDRVSLEQVLVNLVLNAMDALEQVATDRRRIVIRSRRTEPKGVTVCIRDTGPGIAPEALPRVFESFFTTKKEGLGLGLSICRTILEAHRGSIRVENDPAGGASFSLAIPATRPKAAARPAEERIA